MPAHTQQDNSPPLLHPARILGEDKRQFQHGLVLWDGNFQSGYISSRVA